MQCRSQPLEGTGEIKLCRLVEQALWMWPSRIIVGEVRQEESLYLVTSRSDVFLVVLPDQPPLPPGSSSASDSLYLEQCGRAGARRLARVVPKRVPRAPGLSRQRVARSSSAAAYRRTFSLSRYCSTATMVTRASSCLPEAASTVARSTKRSPIASSWSPRRPPTPSGRQPDSRRRGGRRGTRPAPGGRASVRWTRCRRPGMSRALFRAPARCLAVALEQPHLAEHGQQGHSAADFVLVLQHFPLPRQLGGGVEISQQPAGVAETHASGEHRQMKLPSKGEAASSSCRASMARSNMAANMVARVARMLTLSSTAAAPGRGSIRSTRKNAPPGGDRLPTNGPRTPIRAATTRRPGHRALAMWWPTRPGSASELPQTASSVPRSASAFSTADRPSSSPSARIRAAASSSSESPTIPRCGSS